MARRGFVAFSVEYDNTLGALFSDHKAQLACLFTKPQNVRAALCALPNVDCNLGIATWGHSQGALISAMAVNFEPRVRAVWATGLGDASASNISRSRLRIVNGSADSSNAKVAALNISTASSCADGSTQCLRSDGSGWILVQKADLRAASDGGHCWFDKTACGDSTTSLEPAWIDRASTKPFALETNADSVAETAQAP